jgi:hypothetical protein
MTPFGELPQWMDLGPDQDYSAPTADIVSLLKKRMNRKPQGGVGGDLSSVLGDNGDLGKMKPSAEGVKSL